MKSYPTAGIGGVTRLVGSLAVAALRGRDRTSTLAGWVRRTSAGHDAVVVNLLVTRLLLVTGPDLSSHVLARRPSADTFTTGNLKRKGMAFLAPQALTISDGQQWVERRAFNEEVLCTGRTHDLGPTILGHVTAAFATPLGTTADVHGRMAEVMRSVVLGPTAPSGIAHEIDTLIGVAQSPARRKALGWWHRRRRDRLYDAIKDSWTEAPDETLVGRARRFGGPSSERAEQVPHWMFTFTGSATHLLSRTLAIVASRPEVRTRITDEIAAYGALDEVATIDALDYTEACLRETGRLFPPVTRTFHVAPNGGELDGREIPAGIEIVHLFPVQSRDEHDPTSHDFRPERWLGDHPPASNLFLSGARSCPGEGLILLICKAALAQVSGTLTAGTPELAADPLPRSFPVTNVTLRP